MITVTFTDPQGAKHTNAVFAVKSANYACNERQSVNLKPDNSEVVENPTHVHESITAEFVYWINQQAKDDGFEYYYLANTSDDMGGVSQVQFTFQPDETYAGLSLVEKCEKYLQDVLLA